MTLSCADGAPQHPFAHLAEHLKSQRRLARLTQRALAAAAHISRGAVQRAESGTAPPTGAVLDAYLRACGAGETDQQKAHRLIVHGRTVQRGKLAELRALKTPAPGFLGTQRDLGVALVLAYEQAGAPPLRDFDQPGRPRIPLTTAARIVTRQALPASSDQLITFLSVCGIPPSAQLPYLDAYQHVISQRGLRPAPPSRWHRQPTRRIIRRGRPVPLAYDGPDTGTLYDIDRMATAIKPVLDVLAADRDLYNADRLAAGIKPAVDAIAAQSRHYDADRLAAGLRPALEAFALMLRSASREAHRNGTTPPDWINATSLLSHGIDPTQPGTVTVPRPTEDHSIDLIAQTPDGDTHLYQAKSHRQPPGAPPPLTPTPAP